MSFAISRLVSLNALHRWRCSTHKLGLHLSLLIASAYSTDLQFPTSHLCAGGRTDGRTEAQSAVAEHGRRERPPPPPSSPPPPKQAHKLTSPKYRTTQGQVPHYFALSHADPLTVGCCSLHAQARVALHQQPDGLDD